MLSSSAFNAFLKTLEEPPAHAIFILATTEKHKIIPTILSRCQIFDFNRIKIGDIVKRLHYVADNEGVEAEEEALHIIARKADGALRDALSIFDQIVSLCGKKIVYRDVIENLNILDYEYYFKCTNAALNGDVSGILMTFNEILDNGFDGHNFITGLNSHFRDLLVSKDQVTVDLLETTPLVKKRYLEQAQKCSMDFLYKALETGSNCDIYYKSSKNTRLHTELALIKLCRLSDGSGEETEKKKTEHHRDEINETEISPPPKSEIIRKAEEEDTIKGDKSEPQGKHIPVIEKPARRFSIKDIISDSSEKQETPSLTEDNGNESTTEEKKEFSEESFPTAWKDFVDSLKGEGPRILSMFKSIKPEIEDEHTIRIHLSNAAQRDLFVQNYKPRLTGFLDKRFIIDNLDIETSVDLVDAEKIPYTDDQKYNYLQGKYPVLNEFRKAFNLDIN